MTLKPAVTSMTALAPPSVCGHTIWISVQFLGGWLIPRRNQPSPHRNIAIASAAGRLPGLCCSSP
jgi:hypothetical protein